MVQKNLRRRLIIDSFNIRNVPSSKKNVPEYLNGREGRLVRTKIQSDNGFSYKIYSGNNKGIYGFIEYDWNGSIVEYLVHQDNLRVLDDHLIMRDANIQSHSIDSETGKSHMELIIKTKFMEFTSI